MYSCDGNVWFSAAVTPGSHDPSEIILIWFGAQIINFGNSRAALYFCGNSGTFQDYLMIIKFKRTNLLL